MGSASNRPPKAGTSKGVPAPLRAEVADGLIGIADGLIDLAKRLRHAARQVRSGTYAPDFAQYDGWNIEYRVKDLIRQELPRPK